MNGKSVGQYHVVKNSGGRWDVKRTRGSRSGSYFATKKNTIDAAMIIWYYQKIKLFIHNKDGRIEQKDSHDSDSFLPR